MRLKTSVVFAAVAALLKALAIATATSKMFLSLWVIALLLTNMDGICDDEDDCGAVDECGVCNGDGIPEGNATAKAMWRMRWRLWR